MLHWVEKFLIESREGWSKGRKIGTWVGIAPVMPAELLEMLVVLVEPSIVGKRESAM